MKSGKNQLTALDWKKWGINVFKYLVAPNLAVAIAMVIAHLQAGTDINWVAIFTSSAIGFLGAVLDILHRYTSDGNKPLK